MKARARKPPREDLQAIVCASCGTSFTPKNRPDTAKYCSQKCRQVGRRRRDGAKPFQPAVIDGRKQCNTCKEWKSVEDFTARKNRNGAPISDCRPCMATRGRAYHASDRGRNRRYALTYGVSLEWYETKLADQGGRCAICLEVPETRLAVDHCHRTGTPRGLLCFLCNSALGRFDDDPARLRRAADYLKSVGTAH